MKKLLQALLVIATLYSASAGAVIIRGIGDSALIANSLTDQGKIKHTVVFRASDKPDVGAENAFNVFDNNVNTKWCCDLTGWVEADFGTQRYTLTKFTAASANDGPGRDSDQWKILGSNDGVNYTTIFAYNTPGVSPWADRHQVNEYDVGTDFSTPRSYSIFRYQSTAVVNSNIGQISKLQFFGNADAAVPEPDALTLFVLGLAGLALISRKKRA